MKWLPATKLPLLQGACAAAWPCPECASPALSCWCPWLFSLKCCSAWLALQCDTVDYEILAKLGRLEREAEEILRKRKEKEAEGAAALAAADHALSREEAADNSGAEAGSGSAEAAGSSGAEAGSGGAEAAGISSGISGESSSNGTSSGSSSNGSGGAAGTSPAGAAASSAAGGAGKPREAAAGSSSAPAGGDQPEQYTPETAAQRMTYKDMAVWVRCTAPSAAAPAALSVPVHYRLPQSDCMLGMLEVGVCVPCPACFTWDGLPVGWW